MTASSSSTYKFRFELFRAIVTSASETIRKPPLVKAQTALRKQKNNKIWRLTIFNMADEILTPCNVACSSGMTRPWIRPNVRHIGILLLVSISTAVDMSFCTSLRNFIQIGPPSAEKMTSCRFSRWQTSAILDFRGPIMGFLKSPRTTSIQVVNRDHSSKLLSFWENSLFAFWRQTD